MILVLKEADFSASNIGKIELPKELSNFTKQIFNKCTRFTKDSELAIAMDDFVLSLESTGVLSHLTNMYCPWLSNSVEEATYDFISQSQATEVSSSLFMEQPGLLNSNTVATYPSFTFPNAVPTINFFGFIGNVNTSETPVLRNTNISICPYVVQNSTNYNVNGYRVSSTPTASLVEVGALSGLDEDPGTLINGSRVEQNKSFDASVEPFDSQIVKCAPAGYKSTSTKFILFIGDGTKLSSSQRTSLIQAMQTLSDKLIELGA